MHSSCDNIELEDLGYALPRHHCMYVYVLLYVHVNSFKETRQSKQLCPKTTPFFLREKMSWIQTRNVLHPRLTLYQLSH